MNEMERTELKHLRERNRNNKDWPLTQQERIKLQLLSIREKMDARNKYGPIWDFFTFVLYKTDIYNLCKEDYGAPYDEYDAEVLQIVPKIVELHKSGTLSEATAEVVITEVFHKMFGVPGSTSEFGPEQQKQINLAARMACNFFGGLPFMFTINDVKEFIR